jgi:hypothetical protein
MIPLNPCEEIYTMKLTNQSFSQFYSCIKSRGAKPLVVHLNFSVHAKTLKLCMKIVDPFSQYGTTTMI